MEVETELKKLLGPFMDHFKKDMEPVINLALSNIFEKGTQPQRVMFSLARKVLKSFGAVMIMCQRGYGEDAMLLARSMLEAAATAAILEQHPDKTSDFVDFYPIHEYRLLLELRKYDPKYADEIFSSERAQAAENGFKELRKRYGISEKRPFFGQWHCSSLPGLLKQLSKPEYRTLADLYHLSYRLGSDVAHGSVIDLMGRVHKAPEGYAEVEAGPSTNLVTTALAIAHSVMLVVLAIWNNAMKLGMEDPINELNKKHATLWPGNTSKADS